jgi:hypothetical protein
MDKRCTSRNKSKKPDVTWAKPANDSNQKLNLNNKLCSAFCTQAGLSAEAVDRIWELRETSRSNSRVEWYLDTSNILPPFVSSDSNDLTLTNNTSYNHQDLHFIHRYCILCSYIH